MYQCVVKHISEVEAHQIFEQQGLLALGISRQMLPVALSQPECDASVHSMDPSVDLAAGILSGSDHKVAS